MHIARKLRWWGLYALIPLMIGLITLDDETPMSQTWHLILLVAIALVICGLALSWVERNARLVETDGIDRSNASQILLDSADGLSTYTITPEMHPVRKRALVAKHATGAHSPTGQTRVGNESELRDL